MLNDIDNIKDRLEQIEKEKSYLIQELNRLQQFKEPSRITYHNISRLQGNDDSNSVSSKIKLFRRFFRGRDDVYARLWISKKTKITGYSPVCKNEWIQKICKKPIIKCSDCPNRELSPLNDEVIHAHISGNMVVGIYPMLQDETCYFLAVDFDGEDWIDNVFAFKQTCCQEGVPVCIERSRSGNGAHAWVFFDEAIPASIARQMGCFLITETMSNRHQLDMKSYDRLFPNQDTLRRW
jgi:hypothetical protein